MTLIRLLLGLGLTGLLAGCQTTVAMVERERVDQLTSTAAGNRGYLSGIPPAAAEAQPKKRKYISVDVDVTDTLQIKRQQAKAPTVPAQSPAFEPAIEPAQPFVDPLPIVQPPEPQFTPYVVQEGDSLSRIAAKPEIYGNGHKWYRIYQANQDQLKDPNSLRPGMTLNIPRD